MKQSCAVSCHGRCCFGRPASGADEVQAALRAASSLFFHSRRSSLCSFRHVHGRLLRVSALLSLVGFEMNNEWLLFRVVEVTTGQSAKALRSRRMGIEAAVLNKVFDKYSSETRPPVGGCRLSPFIVCVLLDSADHASVVVIVSLLLNRVRWQSDHAVCLDPFEYRL